jgi:hypothetical protein
MIGRPLRRQVVAGESERARRQLRRPRRGWWRARVALRLLDVTNPAIGINLDGAILTNDGVPESLQLLVQADPPFVCHNTLCQCSHGPKAWTSACGHQLIQRFVSGFREDYFQYH